MTRSVVLICCLFVISPVWAQRKTENVILVTMDGMRWQEVFTGAELRLLTDKAYVQDSARLAGKFWNEDPVKRREKLMPFLWSEVRLRGQLYGNRSLGNKVNVSNNQWFSYQGYNELLTGAADNERVHSNDKFENPNKSVLEFINSKKEFQGKVAAFTSWDVFPYILNTQRSGLLVNSGIRQPEAPLNAEERLLNDLMSEVPNPFGDVRLDAFTFRFGFEYMKKKKPRILYLAFDETDDFAHGGKYDLYLEATHYEDQYLAKLWNWVQSTPGYKDKTTLIVTCDHGRGNKNADSWKSHGSKMADSDQIWIAIIGPDSPALGEVGTESQVYQNQVAATIAALLGFEFTSERPVGQPITSVLGVKQ